LAQAFGAQRGCHAVPGAATLAPGAMRLPALAVLAAAPLRIPPVRGLGDAPAAPACSLGDVPAAALGDSVPLCVFLSASPPQKMAFRVKVDASAELLLRGSRQIATNQSAPVNVWVAASQASAAYPLDCADRADIDGRMHKASCPQVYFDSDSVAPIVSLVVTMTEGRITSFAWDNECQNCGPLSCMESPRNLNRTDFAPGGGSLSRGTCGTSVADCRGDGCDLRVYVTWAGTDSSGRHAMSAGMRLSKFTGYTFGSLYDTVVFNTR